MTSPTGEEAIKRKNQERKQLVKEIGTFFKAADADGSESLSRDELQKVLSDEAMRPIIKKLRIPATWSAHELYDYLVKDNNAQQGANSQDGGVTATTLVNAISRWHGDHERAIQKMIVSRRASSSGVSTPRLPM